jgi:tRNA (guanine-N7-)-methyltransferase
MGRIRKIKDADVLIRQYPWFVSKPEEKYFNNNNPLEIEVGSGKGIFLITKAINNPQINYIGIERDSTIVLKALKKINQLAIKPQNLLLINDNALNLEKWFTKNNVNTIYLNFPDP